MVIAFGNQKGGVGKSTICLTLATYWASRGKTLHVIDADMQQSLKIARDLELEEDPTLNPPFPIDFILLRDLAKVLPEMSKSEDKILMIDLPGTYDNDVALVLCYADYIIVPFAYEDWSLESTSKFATYIDIVDEMFPKDNRTAIFVPNHVNKKIGRKEDLENWQEWRDEIASKVTLAPMIPFRACIQRRSSIFHHQDIESCTEECYSFISNLIFKDNPLTNDK